MKKLLSFGLTILVLAMALVGCSQPTSELNTPVATTQPTEAPTEAQKEVSLLYPTWMYELTHDDGRITYLSFHEDNTGLAFYTDDVGTTYSVDYTLEEEKLHVNIEDGTQYDFTYDYDNKAFVPNSGTLEVKTATDAFTIWYNNACEIIGAEGDFTTQYEMTSAAVAEYEAWDDILNVVYNYLLSVLPENEADNLKSDEKSWIDEKEAAMDSEGANYTGGSMEPMIRAGVGADYTKERVKVLIDMIPTP